MAVLGRINGRGTLITKGDEASVSYDITITQSGGLKEASGSIIGGPSDIFAAFNASESLLRLEKGGEIKLIITQIGTPGGEAQVMVSGPVPGF